MSKCDQCEAMMINGVYCHETGCPNAWKDTVINCEDCGCEFVPEERNMTRCDGCEWEFQDSTSAYDEFYGIGYEYGEDLEGLQFHDPIFESDVWGDY